MTRLSRCRLPECDHRVTRAGYCRPHFISDYLGWTLRGHDIREVPLGRLSAAELKALRKDTFGEHKLWRVLQALGDIAPHALPFPQSTAPRLEAAE